jgi:subtilase family serine protease
MSLRPIPRPLRVALTAAATAVTAVALIGAAPAASVSASTTGPATAASSGFTPAVGSHPHYVSAGRPESNRDGQVKFPCQMRTTQFCYGPDQIRAAYQIQPLLDKGVTGRGRTIVVIDAFNPPNVQQELDTFTNTWGLPKANLTVVNPFGAGYDATDPNQQGWAVEMSLDVEWSHVVAPNAKLVLVTAKTNSDADIQDAIDYAVDHRLGDVVSQSFGEDERCLAKDVLARSHATYARGTAKGMTFTASSGDDGSAQPTCDGSGYSLAASTPANDPLNLAVGGTQLFADLTTGVYKSETTWNESLIYGAAGGGGFSTIFRKPSYQYGVVPGRYRGEPDVAYNAAIDGGVLTYVDVLSVDLPAGWYRVGGTSAGAPQWAGLIVLGAQLAHHSLGLVNDSIYLAARVRSVQNYLFHDITTGDNTYTVLDDNGNPTGQVIPGYSAKPGWDAATGFGSPKANHIVPFLAATN